MMFARMLNLDYLNNIDQNQLDLSENDIAKNINNLSVTMENDEVLLNWSDCINSYWKKSYIVRGENSIPTSVYNGEIVGSYTIKDQYYSESFVDKDIKENTLYCYRIFTEFSNEPEYYSGFKNIFYVYVGESEEVVDNNKLIPAVRIIQGPDHRFVSDKQIEKWDNNFSGDYEDLINKPELATVATTGSYEDLLDTPSLATVATSGSYEDLTGKPELSEVSVSGSYEDLVDKPEVYTKEEIDEKFENIPSSGSGSGLQKYKVDENGDCHVIASGTGVTFVKNGSNAEIKVPEGVFLVSAQVRFTSEEIGAASKCTIKYGTDFNYSDNMCMPTVMVLMNNDKSRAYRLAPLPPANLNLDEGNTLELTALPSSQPIVVKLTF